MQAMAMWTCIWEITQSCQQHSLINMVHSLFNIMDVSTEGSPQIPCYCSIPLVYLSSTTISFYWFWFSPVLKALWKLKSKSKFPVFTYYLTFSSPSLFSPNPNFQVKGSLLAKSLKKKITKRFDMILAWWSSPRHTILFHNLPSFFTKYAVLLLMKGCCSQIQRILGER